MRWVLIHLPHLLPPVIAFGLLIRLGAWAADQPPQHYSDEDVQAWVAERAKVRAIRHRPVSPRIALFGTVALVPLLVAFGTGLAIYTFNLRSDRPSAALIWVHTVTSIAGVGLATVKVGLVGWRQVRGRVSLARPHEGLASLALAILGLPLALTGAWLLAHPSGRSFGDYAHLILSVWWTVILQVHLYRYLGRALQASLRPAASPASTARTGS